MKIGIFTDAHYSSARLTCERRYNSKSLRKIEEAYDLFKKEKCELIVCLGDLIDTEPTREKEIENLREVAKVIHASETETLCLMGNHDAFVLTPEEFYGILGLEEPKDRKVCGRKLIFLDACYFKSGVHYAPKDTDWTDTYYPFEELLKSKLDGEKADTYIFIHQNIDPAVLENHRLFNADRLFDMINESGVVKTVFQGHFHPGCRSEYNGVKYITLPAMCECEGKDATCFIFDI